MRKGFAMAKTKRLMDIWLYINRKKNFTAQELSDIFKVSVRTIQRDLIDLTEMGVPFYRVISRNLPLKTGWPSFE
jgi:predicted DNA-binding transcriptional regulator YafY